MNQNNPYDQWSNSETKQVACIIENNLIPKDFFNTPIEDQQPILANIFNKFNLQEHLPDVGEFDVNWIEVWHYLHDTFLGGEEKLQNQPILTDITDSVLPALTAKSSRLVIEEIPDDESE